MQNSNVFASADWQGSAVGGAFLESKTTGPFGGKNDHTLALGFEASYLGWTPFGFRLAHYQGSQSPFPSITSLSVLLQGEIFKFRPQAGIGFGIGSYRKYINQSSGGGSTTVSDGRNTKAAYDLSVGLDYEIAAGLGLGIAYHFLGSGINVGESSREIDAVGSLPLIKCFFNF
ncbi:MAG: hypothetical protein J0L93_10555 [Deltaproteobacteria bacterium]|nr:hypothetical protein [Deltaproteobacteria bacterium]